MNEDLKIAAEHIQTGSLVAFPTETVYGLGADAFNESAIQKIYEAKGRPSSNPLIVHIAELADLSKLTDQVGEEEQKLITAFWPGPLTLVFRKKPTVSAQVTGGLNTVAVRMPAHPLALELIQEAGTPIAAPSAKLSGKPSATHHEHVRTYFGKKGFTLEGGATQHGLESTVLQMKEGLPHIYRLGSITPEDIERVLGVKPILETHSKNSPGTHFKHYAPETQLEILEPEALLKAATSAGPQVGILATTELLVQLPKELPHYDLGSASDLLTVGSHLYSGLIALDALQLNKILVQSFPEKGLGLALMDRLRRASGQKWLA
ncbi:threonylcarbamoyl-AMP synthase [Candidatus Peregrinibacteria bacterium]|nr:MAG: threonylcarbamoyl-AMP synthase [Candidatus Peregrinibacteria bacterium]